MAQEVRGDELKFRQSQGSYTFNFFFEDEELVYDFNSHSSKSVTRIPYSHIHKDTWEFTETNTWFRNIGSVWTLLGGIAELPKFFNDWHQLPYFTFVGSCLLITYFILKTKFTVMDADNARIFVIHDENAEKIVAELKKRRKDALFAIYGEVNLQNDADSEKKKFDALRKEEIIDDETYTKAVELIEHHNSHSQILSPFYKI